MQSHKKADMQIFGRYNAPSWMQGLLNGIVLCRLFGVLYHNTMIDLCERSPINMLPVNISDSLTTKVGSNRQLTLCPGFTTSHGSLHTLIVWLFCTVFYANIRASWTRITNPCRMSIARLFAESFRFLPYVRFGGFLYIPIPWKKYGIICNIFTEWCSDP